MKEETNMPSYPNNINPQMNNNFQQQPQMNSYQMPMNYSNNTNTDRIVENYDFVKYMQIPVDGRTYYFMKADGTEVYSKRWLPDCTTEIKTFREVSNAGGQIEDVESRIIKKLEEMSERIAKIEKNVSFKKPYQNKKYTKEEDK